MRYICTVVAQLRHIRSVRSMNFVFTAASQSSKKGRPEQQKGGGTQGRNAERESVRTTHLFTLHKTTPHLLINNEAEPICV
jgi:hypothetical protein